MLKSIYQISPSENVPKTICKIKVKVISWSKHLVKSFLTFICLQNMTTAFKNNHVNVGVDESFSETAFQFAFLYVSYLQIQSSMTLCCAIVDETVKTNSEYEI